MIKLNLQVKKELNRCDVQLAAVLSPASPLRPLVDDSWASIFLAELIEGGAACLNHRRCAPVSTRRGTLHLTDTEGRPFPEAPIQARAAAASAQRGYDFWQNTTHKKHYYKNNNNNNHKTTMSYQGKKNIPKITVSTKKKRGIMHASLVVATLMAGVAHLCMSVFTATRILRIRATSASQGWDFFPLPLSDLTAGSRRASAMTCYHSDRQADRWDVFLKVSCILFVEVIRARP